MGIFIALVKDQPADVLAKEANEEMDAGVPFTLSEAQYIYECSNAQDTPVHFECNDGKVVCAVGE